MSNEENIPSDRRLSDRVDSGNLVIHTDVGETDPNRTLGLGVTLDLNEFGLKVQSQEPIPLGERFSFSIALRDEVVRATGRVVHVGRALNGTYEMGIEFVNMSARNIEKLRRHLEDRKANPSL